VEVRTPYAAAGSGSRARCRARVLTLTRSAKPKRSVSWGVRPTLCARLRYSVSSSARLIDSVSFRRGKSRSKSASAGGIALRFSVRFSPAFRSASFPRSRTVIDPPPSSAGSE
jgi:hypothetical protein